MTLALALVALLGARGTLDADESFGVRPDDLHRALEVLLTEPLALEVEIAHAALPERRGSGPWRGGIRLAPMLLEARVVGSRAWAVSPGGPPELTFTRDGSGHLLLEESAGHHGVVRVGLDGELLPLSLGFKAVRSPDRGALSADLDRLLDMQALVHWLRKQADWSVMGPTRLMAAAKPAQGEAGWGAITRLEVLARFSVLKQLVDLSVEVRRDLSPTRASVLMPQESARGDLARWRVPFPRATLRLPEAIAGPPLSEGHPDAVDPAHEVTTYVLRPAWKQPSAKLEALMASTKAR